MEQMAQMFGYGISNFFVGFLGVWTLFISLLLGGHLVRSDIQENVLGQILALPVKRSEYLAARLIGGWLIIMGFYLFTGLLIFVIFSTVSEQFVPVTAFLTSLVSMGMMVFVALLVSVFISFYFPGVFSLVASVILIFVILASNNYFSQRDILEVFSKGDGLGIFFGIFYSLFPRIGELSRWNTSILSNVELSQSHLPLVGHSLVSYLIIFLLLNILFKRKDL
jgi:ABC-type transport system involved in multi-copper enzyme maturation permease subunit